jgi:DNA repair protein RecO (recombination protein O)
MAIERSQAVVIGSFPLAESDRVVTFFSRRFGKVRGVARAARRLRSRFGSALELLTLGELVFFDTGRSDLVRVDHFDIVHPFARVRDDLDRLGQAAWMAECAGRLTAERDPNTALYGLLVRALRSLEAGRRPRRVAVVFGVRGIDALGHRLRTDACVGCGVRLAAAGRPVTVDVEGGGVVCEGCAGVTVAGLRVSGQAVAMLARLRTTSWEEATVAPPARAEAELQQLLEAQVTGLIGQPPRASRFVREVERFSPLGGGPR